MATTWQNSSAGVPIAVDSEGCTRPTIDFTVKVSGTIGGGRRRHLAAALGSVHGCFKVIKVILRGFKQVSGSISKISDFRSQV